MINTASAQKQRDLSVLTELQKNDISLDVIYTLSKIVDLKRIAAELKIRTDPWSNFSRSVNNGLGQNGYTNGYNPSKSQNDHVNDNLAGVNNSETTNNGQVVEWPI